MEAKGPVRKLMNHEIQGFHSLSKAIIPTVNMMGAGHMEYQPEKVYLASQTHAQAWTYAMDGQLVSKSTGRLLATWPSCKVPPCSPGLSMA